MTRAAVSCTLSFLFIANCGCLSRALREGAGAATGASGKVFELQPARDLDGYRGLQVGDLRLSQGLRAPENVDRLLREALQEQASEMHLSASGEPALRISGEILHYESGSTTSKAIGPLQEILFRAQLTDAQSSETLGQANLIGRSKALTSSGSENLTAGVAKAMKKWFEANGLGEEEE